MILASLSDFKKYRKEIHLKYDNHMNKPIFKSFNWEMSWKILLSVSILLMIMGVIISIFFHTPFAKWLCYIGLFTLTIINSIVLTCKNRNNQKIIKYEQA